MYGHRDADGLWYMQYGYESRPRWLRGSTCMHPISHNPNYEGGLRADLISRVEITNQPENDSCDDAAATRRRICVFDPLRKGRVAALERVHRRVCKRLVDLVLSLYHARDREVRAARGDGAKVRQAVAEARVPGRLWREEAELAVLALVALAPHEQQAFDHRPIIRGARFCGQAALADLLPVHAHARRVPYHIARLPWGCARHRWTFA